MLRLPAALAALALTAGSIGAFAPAADAASAGGTVATGTSGLANLAHLDFLLADLRLPAVPGHSTTGETPVELPWVYADRNDDGSFRRVGGGALDPATGHYEQGSFDSDDVSRAAVVYVRDWRQSGSASSRDHAKAVLRGLAYFQTTTGGHAGDVVLWMQPDGSLNPSAIPKELPDPSDSGPSFWLARTVWALGEGYAAFRHSDPAFASFLKGRLDLAVRALDREVLNRYGRTVVADGVREPAWLIGDGADQTAEAVLGLTAYVAAQPKDAAARSALTKLAEGLRREARTTTADPGRWPYGAILPSAESRTSWHPWASQMAAALAGASRVLHSRALLAPAVVDSGRFAPTLLAAGGPDDLLGPTPSDRTQIAYGVDSRFEDLVATADATGSAGFARLAALQAGWFFGANPSGEPAYDRATGVTTDGIQPDGTLSRSSGAESTIHGLLAMLTLEAHPSIAAQAIRTTGTGPRVGLTTVEAESAAPTTGSVVTPDPTSTAEYSWSAKALQLDPGQTATIDLGATSGSRSVEAVLQQTQAGSGPVPVSRWSVGTRSVTLRSVVGAQGVSAVPGGLRAQRLAAAVPSSVRRVDVRALSGAPVRIDALLVRPTLSVATFTGAATVRLVQNTGSRGERYRVPATSRAQLVAASGRALGSTTVRAGSSLRLPAGAFALLTSP